MTGQEGTSMQGTASAAGRAACEHAERPAPGWPTVVLRVVGSGLLIVTAAIHLDLYLTGYRTIPTIGWLFLLQVIAAFGLGLAVPPVTGTTAAGQGLPGKVTTITRTDGSHQLTYNGHPLYTYIGDSSGVVTEHR